MVARRRKDDALVSGKMRTRNGNRRNPQVSVRSPALAARDYENVVLVLQGGGALGAYQCGVYEGLFEAGIEPDWFAGISIGAINAAILAGSPAQERVQRLREFWRRISIPAVPLPMAGLQWQLDAIQALNANVWRGANNALGAWNALLHGQSGFFVPHLQPPFSAWSGSAEATSFYSTSPLRRSLSELVDFERINHRDAPRFSVGCVDVATGNFRYFDNRETTIRVEHVMASGALPPAFAPVEVEGSFYWDGGLVSNTPLEYVLESVPRRDTLAFQVDLWSARGRLPTTLLDALERQKDIQYSSRTRRATDTATQRQKLRLAIGRVIEQLPDRKLPADLAAALDPWTCSKVLNVIHLIYQSRPYEEQYKDYAFGAETMREHWQSGLGDMRRTLEQPGYFTRPSADVGVATHDIHRGRET